jgi:hypothetical protein
MHKPQDSLDTEHRFTRPHHPWTKGQVEGMNCTIKEATVRRYYFETLARPREHLALGRIKAPQL